MVTNIMVSIDEESLMDTGTINGQMEIFTQDNLLMDLDLEKECSREYKDNYTKAILKMMRNMDLESKDTKEDNILKGNLT